MVSRDMALLGLLAVAAVLGGCGSSKEFEGQILALDKQVAGLQEQVVAREADVAGLRDVRVKLEKDVDTLTTEKADLQAMTEVVVYSEIAEILNFGVDQYKIQDDMKSTLASVALMARQNPDWILYVVGHTDRVAQDPEIQYYLPTAWELAAFRATNAARYLIETEGLADAQVVACSRGNSVVLVPNDNEAGRAQNRRVTFYLRKPEAVPAAPEAPPAEQ
jgi:outer membrane protein OmpA-like peptidoglycan-associated protein